MSALTSPDNITYPVSTDSFGPLETVFATMAASIQTAFSNTKTYRTADQNSLLAITGATSGAIATVIEGGAIFSYDGAIWQQKSVATFATTGARDSAYAKASGGYRVAGAQVRITTSGYVTQWQPSTGVWRVADAGMVPIIPTSVTGATLSGGTINFSASGQVTMLGVFSADFEFYKIVMRYTKSTSANLMLQLANGGTPSTGGYYFQSNIDIGTAATVPVSGAGTASAQIDQGAVSTPTHLVMELTDPFLAAPTLGMQQSTATNGTAFTARGSWNHSPSVSFADLNIYPSAGALAGTMHIYGYSLA